MNESEQEQGENHEMLKKENDAFSLRENRRLQDYFSILQRRTIDIPQNELQQQSFLIKYPNNEKNKEIKIAQFTYHNAALNRDIWLIAAVNEDNQLLGIRQTYFQKESQGTLKAQGNIEVLQRGKGIASAIEALHVKLLKEKVENDESINEIDYIVDDANGRRLEELTRELQKAKKGSDMKAIAQLQQELSQANTQRLAWMKLYGNRGTLGFSTNGDQLEKKITRDSPLSDSGPVIEKTAEEINLQEIIESASEKLQEQESRITNYTEKE